MIIEAGKEPGEMDFMSVLHWNNWRRGKGRKGERRRRRSRRGGGREGREKVEGNGRRSRAH